MSNDPVRGKTLRFTFNDGPMSGKTYDHAFGTDGTVTWTDATDGGATGANAAPDPESTAPYEFERVNADVYVVTYLSKAGYTLTSVVDTSTGKLVSFASNEKSLSVQHGTAEGPKAA